MNSRWRQIWEKRRGDVNALKKMSFDRMVLELKELNGFDSVKEKTSLCYEAIIKEYENIKADFLFQKSGGGGIWKASMR